MIEIRNERGEIADLYPDTSISVEKNNPLFNDNDKFFEDITYSFVLPATENNKVFFKFGHLVEAKNNVYKMPVSCIVAGLPFFAGSIRYSFSAGDFEALLLINFGDLAEIAKTVKMKDIFTQDADLTTFPLDKMKTVCQNPAEYAYSFFPVYNDKWNGDASPYPIINYWDHELQAFNLVFYSDSGYTAFTPYFKLKFFIVKLMEFFGFKTSGSWIDDPESDKIFCYNVITTGGSRVIYDSFLYLPSDLTPVDFLKIIKERFSITCSFDFFSCIAKVDSASSIMKSEDVLDLSAFISEINEISLPEETEGYSITLQPDNSDELWLDKVNVADKKYIPTNTLIIGNGKVKKELKSSTLKQKQYTGYSMPTAKHKLSYLKAKEINNPLRFLRFNGMKSLPGGKVFPEAYPLELDASSAIWWQFLNDSKKIKLTGSIPPSILVNLNSSQKIGFKSQQGVYCLAMLEKTSFSLKNNEEEFITTTLEVRTIVFDYSTPVTIKTNEEILTDETKISVKAFFNTEETGINEVEISVYYALTTPRTDLGKIKISTDKYGLNGQTLNFPDVAREVRTVVELRIFSFKPKYALLACKKHLFLQRDNYWYLQISQISSTYVGDNRAIFIVF